MLIETPYNRVATVEYAEKWAYKRNPRYTDFDGMGGDCTNFASQCLFAGCGVMNYTPVQGWFYGNLGYRSPSWSSVEFLYRFLVGNSSAGPYARHAEIDELLSGDLIQLGSSQGVFYHTLVVMRVSEGTVHVAAHTYDALYRPLSSYSYSRSRGLHISGARKHAGA